MILTNKSGLPDAIVRAVQNDSYTKGDADFSVTELLKPPRQRILQKQYAEFIEEDVSDRIWALLGQVMHGILERAETYALTEKRYYASLHTSMGGISISGQTDNLDIEGKKLIDYKLCSIWEVIYGLREHREQQLNMYRWLLAENGINVDELEVVAIMRDWSLPKAMRDMTYPQEQTARIAVPVWPMERTKEFIRERVEIHLEAENAEKQEELPECTAEERWVRDEKWAVMKKGRKSAVKLHNSPESAEAHLEADASHYIEHRPGVANNCVYYCNVSKFCKQYRNGEAAAIQAVPKKIWPEFRWHTMEGDVLSIDEMDTGHIFNSMKMIYNHLAEQSRDCLPVWFNHKYSDYENLVTTDTMNLIKQVVFFIYHIEQRKDLPAKYAEPYRKILSQVLQKKTLTETTKYFLNGGHNGTRND